MSYLEPNEPTPIMIAALLIINVGILFIAIIQHNLPVVTYTLLWWVLLAFLIKENRD